MIRVDGLPIWPVKVVLKLVRDALAHRDLTERGGRVSMEIVLLLVEVSFGWWVASGRDRVLTIEKTLAEVAQTGITSFAKIAVAILSCLTPISDQV